MVQDHGSESIRPRNGRPGKRVGSVLYIHVSAIDQLEEDEVARIKQVKGRVGDHWNVAKITPDTVSLLSYEDFDSAAFPRLRHAWRLAGSDVVHKDYTERANPPILHRKELLLRSDDPRIELFADLTRQAVERGLFVDAHRIGTADAWEKRLAEAGLVIVGHRLTDRDSPIARHRTAIARNRLSTPMQQLVLHGYIKEGVAVFDYGCGHGDDVRVLRESGIEASGWDPYYAPAAARTEAEVVNLGFVLNVIEAPEERVEVLRRAFSLTRRVLAVAVMVTGQRLTDGLRPHGDGHLTTRATFQKYFAQFELRELIAGALNREPVTVAPGVIFAFRNTEDEQDFLDRRQSRQRLWPINLGFGAPAQAALLGDAQTRLSPLVDDVAAAWLRLGRPPARDEIPPSTSASMRDAGLSLKRAVRLGVERLGLEQLAASEASRREDLTLLFAMRHFERRSRAGLSERLHRDVRHFFSSFAKAEEIGASFLFSLGKLDTLIFAADAAIADGLAHCAGDVVHFHREVLEKLPLALRGFMACVTVVQGGLDEVDVVAIDIAERRATLFRVPEFDARLPFIVRTTKISLTRQTLQDRTYVAGQRRIFLSRSCYPSTNGQIADRYALEMKIRNLLSIPDDRITCREEDLVAKLRAAKDDGSRSSQIV